MRKLIKAGIVLLVFAAGVIALAVTFITPERWKPEIEQRLSEGFGRPVRIGLMRFTIFSGIGIAVDNLVVDGSPEFGETTFMTVDSLWIDIGVLDLVLRQSLSADRVVVDRPRITLVKREDGVWNWTALGASPAARTASGSRSVLAVTGLTWAVEDSVQLAPGRLEIRAAEVTVANRGAKPATEYVYKNVSLDARISPGRDGLSVRGRIEADSAAEGGEPLLADLPFDMILTPPTEETPVWQTRGNIAEGKFATRNVRVASINTSFELDRNQQLRLPDLKAALFDGFFDGRFSLDLTTPENRFALDGRFAAISIDGALAPLPDLAQTVHGKAGGSFSGSGELGDFAFTVASMQGKGNLTIEQARLTSFNVLAEVTGQGGFPVGEFGEDGTSAEHLEARFVLKGGRMTFEEGVIQGINGLADLRVDSGWLDLKSPASLNVEGNATLLPPLIRKIREANPAAGLVLGALGDGPVTVPLTISGPMTKPRVAVKWGTILKLPFGV